MSILQKLFSRKAAPKQRVRVCVECGMPVAEHKEWCSILRTQRDWNDGQAKKRLIAAFATLDDEDLVGTYRRKMASLLF